MESLAVSVHPLDILQQAFTVMEDLPALVAVSITIGAISILTAASGRAAIATATG